MFGKSLLNVSVASLGVLAISQAVEASLIVDLRFTDGNDAKIINAGDLTPITIQAWAAVTGAAGNNAEEGLQSVIAAIRSNIVLPGITGGITSASLASGWGGSGSAVGVATNLSADGIGDWGNASNTPLTLGTTFFRARTTKSVPNQIDFGDATSPAGSTFNNLADGGAEFLIGTFTFTPTAAATGAVLRYAPSTVLGGTVAPAGWWEDAGDTSAANPTGGKLVANGTLGPATPNALQVNAVTITVIPEPTTLGLAGLAGLGLIRRRRA